MPNQDSKSPRVPTHSPIKGLLVYAIPYTRLFAGVIALVILYNLTQVIQPYLVKIAIDRYLLVKNSILSPLIQIGFLYLAITLVGLLANLYQTRVIASAGQQIVWQIRIDLFSHIESLSMDYFETHDTGRLITNVASDTTRISQFFTQFLLSVIRDGLTIILVMGAMLLLNWRLGLLSALVIPLIVLISAIFRPRLHKIYNTTRSRQSRLIGFIAENLSGMRIIQIFHQEKKQLDAFNQLNVPYQNANVNEFRWDVLFNRSFDLLGNLAVAFMAWAGGLAVFHHSIKIGVLYAFISYIQQFFEPINSLTQNWNTLQSSMISFERVSSVLATSPTLKDPDLPYPLEPSSAPLLGQVDFDHVSFAYKPEAPILQDISMHIAPGQFIGIAGETGAGKSTLISLLARFYDVSDGAIRIDGIDIRQIRQDDLHKIVAVVQQDVNLYSGTIADNIRLFRDDISLEQIEEACRITGADVFIRRLRQGYDTWLTPHGSNLSTGQRQLLAFARTILLDPKILVLDEATANLDAVSEMAVQKGLMEVAKNRTTIVIAHRLSTLRYADRIFVLDHGRIVESGTHDELLAHNGYYAHMIHKSAWMLEPTGSA
ncbi:MAG: ABC transporter ATP-binding protein [Sulfobacillus thermosulfidooxidans]|uniref:ABC transporter ATP-binding protein n=1 Tax=Sulfobacillus thermosulfidooxidans TaxID=28034 RepID=A0A2T2WXA7_SULTH|nr:MAG: ABC transporter ATP-binding protein [Sulfobacillus thermosulfidooxidans]